MDYIIPSLAGLLEPFRPCFRLEAFDNFRHVVTAWLVCPGTHTLSEVWQVCALSARPGRRPVHDVGGHRRPRAHRQKKTPQAAERDREDVKEARRVLGAAQALLDPSRLVFVDESGATADMGRRYGRSPSGQRLPGKAPFGHRKVTTVVAALRADGVDAVMTLDGAMDGDYFVAYVGEVLAPALRSGDVVFMDNLSSHERAEARALIEARGRRWCSCRRTARTSTPSRMAFSKLKAILRRREERTAEGLRAAIFAELAAFPAQECPNFLEPPGTPLRQLRHRSNQ